MNSPDGQIFPFRRPRPATSENRNPRFVVMYHGSAVERNGLDLAVDALVRVRKNIPAAELRIVSPKTPFLERVMEYARNQGLGEAVQYLGQKQLEDLVPEIEECDVGIIPNHRNAFTEINTPTRIFEYLALGKPVIVPRTAGIQDYFGETSLLYFEAGDAADLACRIEHVYHHMGEANAITERGQKIYLAHTWDQERRTLINLVRNLLGEYQHFDTAMRDSAGEEVHSKVLRA